MRVVEVSSPTKVVPFGFLRPGQAFKYPTGDQFYIKVHKLGCDGCAVALAHGGVYDEKPMKLVVPVDSNVIISDGQPVALLAIDPGLMEKFMELHKKFMELHKKWIAIGEPDDDLSVDMFLRYMMDVTMEDMPELFQDPIIMERIYCNVCHSEQMHVLEPGVAYRCLRCRSLGRTTPRPVGLRKPVSDPRD